MMNVLDSGSLSSEGTPPHSMDLIALAAYVEKVQGTLSEASGMHYTASWVTLENSNLAQTTMIFPLPVFENILLVSCVDYFSASKHTRRQCVKYSNSCSSIPFNLHVSMRWCDEGTPCPRLDLSSDSALDELSAPPFWFLRRVRFSPHTDSGRGICMEGLVSSTELSFIEGMNGRDAPIGMLERSTFSLSDRSRLSGELFDRMHTNAPDNQLTMAVYSAAQFAEHVLLKSGSSGDVSMPQDSSSKEALLSIKNIDDCRDSRGNARGACSEDDCEFYSPPAQGSKCDYCDCPAPKHKKLTAEEIDFIIAHSRTRTTRSASNVNNGALTTAYDPAKDYERLRKLHGEMVASCESEMLDNGNKMFKRVFHGTGLEQPLVHICVLFGWENSLLQILDAFPHMVNLVNGDGSTLMDLAKETGNLKFMELLSKFDALETKRKVDCTLTEMNDSSYRALLDLADGVYRLHASAGEVIGDNIIDSEPRSLWGSLKLAVTRRSDSDPCLFGEHRGGAEPVSVTRYPSRDVLEVQGDFGWVRGVHTISMAGYYLNNMLASQLLESLNGSEVLTYLDLSSNGLSSSVVQDLVEALSRCPNVSSLSLACNPLGTRGVRLLKPYLSVPEVRNHLESLSLECVKLEDAGVGYLSQAFEQQGAEFALRALDLSGNSIGSDGTKYIDRILHHAPSLEELSLASNYIQDPSEMRSGVISHTSLRLLNISANDIKPAGLEAIATMVSRSSTLESLFLSSNYDACTDLPAVDAFGRCVSMSSSLKSLGICVPMRSDVCAIFIENVEANTTLQELYAHENLRRDVIAVCNGNKALANARDTPNGAVQFVCGECRLSRDKLDMLLRFLPTSIRELDLSNVGMTEVPYELTRLTRLESLNIADNRVSRIPCFMAPMKSLLQVNVAHNPIKNIGDVIDPRKVLDYLRLMYESVPTKRLRLILFGDPASGKTSLLRCLKRAETNAMKRLWSRISSNTSSASSQPPTPTNGVYIPSPANRILWSEVLYLTVADVGGASKEHLPMEYYVSRHRSIAIIVVDCSRPIEEQRDSIDTWMAVLNQSTAATRDSPVKIVLIGTKVDQIRTDGHRQEVERMLQHIQRSNARVWKTMLFSCTEKTDKKGVLRELGVACMNQLKLNSTVRRFCEDIAVSFARVVAEDISGSGNMDDDYREVFQRLVSRALLLPAREFLDVMHGNYFDMHDEDVDEAMRYMSDVGLICYDAPSGLISLLPALFSRVLSMCMSHEAIANLPGAEFGSHMQQRSVIPRADLARMVRALITRDEALTQYEPIKKFLRGILRSAEDERAFIKHFCRLGLCLELEGGGSLVHTQSGFLFPALRPWGELTPFICVLRCMGEVSDVSGVEGVSSTESSSVASVRDDSICAVSWQFKPIPSTMFVRLVVGLSQHLDQKYKVFCNGVRLADACGNQAALMMWNNAIASGTVKSLRGVVLSECSIVCVSFGPDPSAIVQEVRRVLQVTRTSYFPSLEIGFERLCPACLLVTSPAPGVRPMGHPRGAVTADDAVQQCTSCGHRATYRELTHGQALPLLPSSGEGSGSRHKCLLSSSLEMRIRPSTSIAQRSSAMTVLRGGDRDAVRREAFESIQQLLQSQLVGADGSLPVLESAVLIHNEEQVAAFFERCERLAGAAEHPRAGWENPKRPEETEWRRAVLRRLQVNELQVWGNEGAHVVPGWLMLPSVGREDDTWLLEAVDARLRDCEANGTPMAQSAGVAVSSHCASGVAERAPTVQCGLHSPVLLVWAIAGRPYPAINALDEPEDMEQYDSRAALVDSRGKVCGPTSSESVVGTAVSVRREQQLVASSLIFYRFKTDIVRDWQCVVLWVDTNVAANEAVKHHLETSADGAIWIAQFMSLSALQDWLTKFRSTARILANKGQLRIITNRYRPHDGEAKAAERVCNWVRGSEWAGTPVLIFCGNSATVSELHQPEHHMYVTTSVSGALRFCAEGAAD